MAFAGKQPDASTPSRKLKPNFYACESCGAPLVAQWVTRDGGKVRNPEDDTNHCLKCAGLVQAGPPPETHYRWVYLAGVLTLPMLYLLFWHLLPAGFRMVFK